ncbi:MAG TPA: PKD domain-containing protein [Chitinophagaceae bacterium]|nr:PKD domain-containing protein [Chitinophagaceae bacterium]
MKRQFLSLSVVLLLALSSYANHISGGEMSYSFVSRVGNNYSYIIRLKLFRDGLGGGPQLATTEAIAVYFKGTNTLDTLFLTVPRVSFNTIQLTNPGPCIINPPQVIYDVAVYETPVTLPGNLNGYIITYQRCCRVGGIINVSNSAAQGVTYSADIPGTFPEPSAPANNSARFLGIDTVVICAGYPFTYNFGAEDNDGDALIYSFCDAFTGGAAGDPTPIPPDPPPYIPVPYSPPFAGSLPLGTGVTINPNTGVITGIAPSSGTYVVTVCVQEWRNGKLIATQRKDLQVKVADCDVATVTLEPDGYINCNDYSMSFNNLSPSALINNYFWDFGDHTTLADTSRLTGPGYTYPDTGIYIVKVVANRNQPCSDSTTAQVRVYPGFVPDFDFTGMCMNVPLQFNDLTTATYGNVNFWRYDFGVTSALNDTSRLQHPQYTYNAVGNYTAELVVGSSKGCRDTVYKTVTIIDKPPIAMAFRDTLICNIDTIQLNAIGSGAMSWTPDYNILNPTSAAPFVFPKVTTWYKVELNENGCRNTDSVRIRVVSLVNLAVSNDTSICVNDPVQLFANTDGLQYIWTPAASLSNATILNPVASPAISTTYQITSRIGGCFTTEEVVVTLIARPTVNAGADEKICYNSTTQLNGQTNGTSFTWSPSSSLDNAGLLDPVAGPTGTTSYVLAATDIASGCPKPSYDTVVIVVLPKVNAFAGNDTVGIAGFPLQLIATGGVSYQWSPATNLTNPDIAGPVVMLDGDPEFVSYLVTVADQAGCTDTASIRIRVFKTGPEIFLPTGFTPNGDGRNDVFRPIYVGMKTIDYFQVYNRWGALLYSNDRDNGQGWDGTIKGQRQNTGAFVWMVRATDLLGKVHFKKGTVMLIR